MQRNKFSRVGVALGLALGFGIGLSSAAMADPTAQTQVCKKRSHASYHAFYRTELTTTDTGDIRFEYGIGDETQIYELYFFGPVTRVSETRYESPQGMDPRVAIDLVKKRRKVELQFTVTSSSGQSAKRDGYVCD